MKRWIRYKRIGYLRKTRDLLLRVKSLKEFAKLIRMQPEVETAYSLYANFYETKFIAIKLNDGSFIEVAHYDPKFVILVATMKWYWYSYKRIR